MASLDEEKLKAELVKRGYESASIKAGARGKISIDANKLYPVEDGEGGKLHVAIPVSFSLEVSKNGDIRSLEEEEPSPAAIEDARSFVKGLRQRSEIEGMTAASSSGKPTYRIEKDAQGRRVLRRILAR